MKTNDYRSGNIARLIGTTQEALRFYQNKKIYSPNKKGESKYDIYSDHDLSSLYNLRFYKTLGLSLKKSGEVIKNQTFESFINNIEVCKEFIQRNNQWNKIILKHINRMESLTKRIEDSCEIIIEDYIPEIYVFSLLNNKNITKEETVLLKELATLTPAIIPINMVSSDYIRNTDMKSTSLRGIYVEDMWFFEKYYNLNNLIKNNIFKKIPASKCISTIIGIDSEKRYDDKAFNNVIQYINNSQYIVNGEILGSVIAVNYKKKNALKMYDYYIVWIPISGN